MVNATVEQDFSGDFVKMLDRVNSDLSEASFGAVPVRGNLVAVFGDDVLETGAILRERLASLRPDVTHEVAHGTNGKRWVTLYECQGIDPDGAAHYLFEDVWSVFLNAGGAISLSQHRAALRVCGYMV